MAAEPGGTRRTIWIGGLTRAQLCEELAKRAIELNEYARQLLDSGVLATSQARRQVEVAIVAVGDLGLDDGGTIVDVAERAADVGLTLCPLELGPHFRLQFLDQPEADLSGGERPHRAPTGSITIASEPLIDEDGDCRGFYLRRVAGMLWLRGYVSGPEHLWQPDDRFAFLSDREV